MQFWAIAYKYQGEVFYNIATEEDTIKLTEQCLLPTEALAIQLIKESLTDDYKPVEINLHSLQANGIYSYSRGDVKEWDEEEEEEEEC